MRFFRQSQSVEIHATETKLSCGRVRHLWLVYNFITLVCYVTLHEGHKVLCQSARLCTAQRYIDTLLSANIKPNFKFLYILLGLKKTYNVWKVLT